MKYKLVGFVLNCVLSIFLLDISQIWLNNCCCGNHEAGLDLDDVSSFLTITETDDCPCMDHHFNCNCLCHAGQAKVLVKPAFFNFLRFKFFSPEYFTNLYLEIELPPLFKPPKSC